ncbi:MAG: alpha/beta hydrolase [Gammaproteobacteria bacterium]|nr:alpha/beta hydrolase [Gammaproteobacteria bacterium]
MPRQRQGTTDEELVFQRAQERDAQLDFPGADSSAVTAPAQPRLNSFLSLGPGGFHRVAYTEWGDPNSTHIVVCMHGFTRNSRDFDVLAASLADRCRVICVDVVGRGTSDWLRDKDDYDFSLYMTDAATLLARVMALPLKTRKDDDPALAASVDWVGTSMGGLIGMMLAAKANTPIRRLVLNDVGPLVPWRGLMRLKDLHAGLRSRFKNLEQLEDCLRRICADFGPIDDKYWEQIVIHSTRQLADGDYVLAYDPGIMSSMRHSRRGIEFGNDFLSGVDLWPMWDRVRCPTLVLRGARTDLLMRSTVDEMRRRGPAVRVVEFPGIGHAPWLMADDQIDVVREFLLTSTSPPQIQQLATDDRRRA